MRRTTRTGLWTAALAALVVAGPTSALADDEAGATTEEAPEAADDTEGAADDDAPKGAAKDGAPSADASVEAEAGEDEDELNADETAAALGAANPVVASNSGKPWTLMGNTGFSVNSGSFVSNPDFSAGYNVAATGLYRVSALFKGRLDALVRMSATQSIDDGRGGLVLGGSPTRFIFNDVRIGLLGRGLYKWKWAGLTLGAQTSIDLPTSELAQEAGRIFRWNVGFNAVDLLQGVGPGNLLVTAGLTFRKDAADINPSAPIRSQGELLSACRESNQIDRNNCATNRAGLDFALLYGGSVRYFLGPWSLGASVTFVDNFFHDISQSELPERLEAGEVTVGSSPNASPGATNRSILMAPSVSLTYVFSANFNASLGMSSFQALFQGSEGDGNPRTVGDFNSREVPSPFFNDPIADATSVFAAFTAMY